jgi:peroxiredoxin (alkyl hydroperoxide reductase subunit C)
MILVGKKAPIFRATAVAKDRFIPSFSLEDYLGKYVIFFFYPLDFTFVCPTELHAFQESLSEFTKRNAEVIACSIDSQFSHLAWLTTLKEKGGICGVEYPIVSDIHKQIARQYGVLSEEEGIAYRGLFLLDKQGVVRHQVINDFPLGRSVDETLRMLDALTFHEKHGEVCPANWNSSKKAMTADQSGLQNYFNA